MSAVSRIKVGGCYELTVPVKHSWLESAPAGRCHHPHSDFLLQRLEDADEVSFTVVDIELW